MMQTINNSLNSSNLLKEVGEQSSIDFFVSNGFVTYTVVTLDRIIVFLLKKTLLILFNLVRND